MTRLEPFRFLAIAAITGALVTAGACDDDDPAVTPDGGLTGDGGAAPTFTQVYTQVITPRCAPCHTTAAGTGVVMGRLDMTSRAAAHTNLVNVAAMGGSCTGMGTRVIPGSAATSILFQKVSPDLPTPCGSKMPMGSAGLPRAEADLIERWIAAGARND
jgi:hypothetical protein